MPATTESFALSQGHADNFPARLRLKGLGAARGLLDGAWWLHSRGLPWELPVAARVPACLRMRITCTALNNYWLSISREVVIPGRVITGRFAGDADADMIVLSSNGVDRWDLRWFRRRQCRFTERLMAR